MPKRTAQVWLLPFRILFRRAMHTGAASAGLALCAALALAIVAVRIHVLPVQRASLAAFSSAASDGAAASDSKAQNPKRASIELDHPSRMDGYGCLFTGCLDSGSLSAKVARLRHALRHLRGLQAHFGRQLSRLPVKTTLSVLPGEPGLLGARGDRGLPGPQAIVPTCSRTCSSTIPRVTILRMWIEGTFSAHRAHADAANTSMQGYPGKTGAQGRPGFSGRPGPVGNEGPRGLRGERGRQVRLHARDRLHARKPDYLQT